MVDINDLQKFDFNNSYVKLWVFKSYSRADKDPSFTGRWVDTTDDVIQTLRKIAQDQIEKIEEVQEYSLLAQNNEASALSISTIETHGGLITQAAAEETEDCKVKKITEIINSDFYVAKFIHDDKIVYAVKKTTSGWKTKKAFNTRRLFFQDNQLTLNKEPYFEIANSIDLFIVDDNIFCLHKKRSESILYYKQAHINDFIKLQQDIKFSGIFAEMGPLIKYIGNNKIHLRRASAIKEKGHFKDQDFINRLIANQEKYKLNIQFDKEGKIIATAETASDIITVFLDHRLASGFSEDIYDVQNTARVL
ncbi:MAG: DUF4868 domain-containing protein [Aliivibrio sp.]|uniref:Kiwa anti-phage protein KwaB-like domain-containing protein n=1 Tax=Aliivibrio sp. TaxID=1872443 RepID=UPI001A3EE7AC|nr:DUF4868 domain-containing protein [Aliivibrio sp.]